MASRKFFTDGADLLFDYARRRGDTGEAALAREMVVVRSGRRVFSEVMEPYLRRIEYSADGYASLVHLTVYGHAKVVADSARSFGAPMFERGGSRVDDVLHRFWAGESLVELSAEFGVPEDQLEDVLRVASRRAA